MDNSFDRIINKWEVVDESMIKVEEAPFYTEETAWDLEHSAQMFLESVRLWRRLHGDAE